MALSLEVMKLLLKPKVINLSPRWTFFSVSQVEFLFPGIFISGVIVCRPSCHPICFAL